MSKTNKMLILKPSYKGLTETIVSGGYKCEYCQGNGYFWKEEGFEHVKDPCPVCKGSGRLKAVVTIEWKPTKKDE